MYHNLIEKYIRKKKKGTHLILQHILQHISNWTHLRTCVIQRDFYFFKDSLTLHIYLCRIHEFLFFARELCGFNHHGNSLEGVGPSVELCPVDPILVATAIVSTSIPHTVQIGVGTHVIPPASFLVMSTVTWKHKERAENHWQTKKQKKQPPNDSELLSGSRPV